MLTHKEARVQAKEIVAKMTLEEKIDQINFRAPAIERLGIPDYNYWNEALHGVARAGVATVFPQAIGLAAIFDEAFMEKVADIISTEGRAKYNQYHGEADNDIYKGLTFWSPNINIFRDPRWGRGQETYGEDPYLTARMGVAFIKGLQGDGPYMKLAACAKHFAVHSGPEADRHSFDAVVSKKDMYETYLPAFEAAVKEADVESFMGAYNAVNGIPACVHPELMQEILRGKWNFQGHVVSDYAALEDVHLNHHYTNNAAETMALAMQIGCNLCAGNISDALYEAHGRGLVTEEEITNSVIELYTTRVRLGMFADDNELDKIPYEVNASKDHQKVSLEAARKSMVLLENKDFLPLNKVDIQAVAVIGPNARSVEVLQGNYFGIAERNTTFVDGLQNYLGDDARVFYAPGGHLFKEHAESTLSRPFERESEAIIAAKHSDVVVLCLGLDPTIEGEQGDSGNVYGSGDKYDLFLPEVQRRLLEKVLAIGKPVILAVSAGSAISLNGLEEHPNLKAIVHTWYPGSHGGTALAEMIFGEISPSGKLPLTFYRTAENLPDFSDYGMKNRTYRYLEETPLYPFGYGLHYSKVELKDLVVNKANECYNVEVTVENTGDFDIEEVIQVYAKTDSKHETLNGKLVGFKRIALAKGAIETVKLDVPVSNLTVVDDAGERILDGEKVLLTISTGFPCDRLAELNQPTPLSEELLLK
ncbi:MAG TPA: glycoside hydrolase family 3 C-terminal domain-containing protein [Globicatella sulfidifaciens]|nr:glycoside hydrolase family 3 C-terminal domain-containing protein [Globicatella sulfidifaciens]